MKRCYDILIAVFVSVQTLILLLVLAAYMYFPAELSSIGSRIAAGPDGVKYLALLPGALLALAAKEYAQILFPNGVQSVEFQQWPEYNMVKDRYYIIVGTLFLCTCLSCGLWAISVTFTKPSHMCLFFGSLLIAVSSYADLFFAKISLRRILATACAVNGDGHSEQESPIPLDSERSTDED